MKQLGFEKIVEGRYVSYVFHGDDFDVYADIRSKPKLIFYIYKLPRRRSRATKAMLTSNCLIALRAISQESGVLHLQRR